MDRLLLLDWLVIPTEELELEVDEELELEDCEEYPRELLEDFEEDVLELEELEEEDSDSSAGVS